MKRISQIIAAASGLAVPVMLLSWPGVLESDIRARTATQRASVRTGNMERDARATFESKCATCHGKDGRAKTFKAKFNKARDLSDAA